MVNFIQVGNRTVDSSTFKKLLQEDLDEAIDEIVEEITDNIVEDIQKLIRNLNSSTTDRGRGTLADEYNQPMANTRVDKIPEPKNGRKNFTVRVLGRVFNILDSGSPPRRASSLNPMKFPVYNGNLTIPNDPDHFGSVNVNSEPRWVTAVRVDAIAPRNYLRTIANRNSENKRIQLRTKRGLFAGSRYLEDIVKVEINQD